MSGLRFEDIFTPSTDVPVRSTNSSTKESKPVKSKADLDVFLKKTPLSILEEGAKGCYQQTPSWECRDIPTTTGLTEFEMVLSLRGINVKARANNKKTAKHRAAGLYLHEVVKKGNQKEFSIPGETEEEAHSYIDQIVDRCDESKRTTQSAEGAEYEGLDKSIRTMFSIPESGNQNWVGKLQERSQKNKMETPTYEDSVLPSKKFAVVCRLGKQAIRGVSNTKKGAKNISAYFMLQLLEHDVTVLDNFDFDEEIEHLEQEDHLATVQTAVFKQNDHQQALVDLLSDTKRFAAYSMDVHCVSTSTMGLVQLLLEVQTTRPVSPDPDDLQMGAEHTQTEEIMRAAAEKERERKNLPEPGSKVFSGYGSTEEEARQRACQSALIHFNTYCFTSSCT